MDKEISEVLKEYVIDVDDLEFRVKGRLVKTTNEGRQEKYGWAISHYCAGTEDAGPYVPSKIWWDTYEAAEGNLLAYMKSFDASFGVQPNKFY